METEADVAPLEHRSETESDNIRSAAPVAASVVKRNPNSVFCAISLANGMATSLSDNLRSFWMRKEFAHILRCAREKPVAASRQTRGFFTGNLHFLLSLELLFFYWHI